MEHLQGPGKYFVVTAICLASRLAAAEGTQPTAPTTYGSIKLAETAFDFGEVYRGTELSHRFKFTNPGPGPVVIQGVHAACGCTAVEVDKGHHYGPGESGFVDVKLNTTDFAGMLVKTVTVMSNEKLLPDRTLTLKALVKSEIEVDPPLVDFGDTRAALGESKVVRIKAQNGANLTIKDLLYNQNLMLATVAKDPQAVPGKDAWLLNIQLKTGLTPGFLKETIIVHNSTTNLKELPVPVRANILGDIDYNPSYLEFGAIAPAEVARRAITMHGIKEFDVTGTRTELIINGRKVDDATGYIKVNSVPHEKDKRLVSVELKNESKIAGSVHGKLYIQTTDVAQRELAVDFYAFFR